MTVVQCLCVTDLLGLGERLGEPPMVARMLAGATKVGLSLCTAEAFWEGETVLIARCLTEAIGGLNRLAKRWLSDTGPGCTLNTAVESLLVGLLRGGRVGVLEPALW
jgi:hypothetical protein